MHLFGQADLQMGNRRPAIDQIADSSHYSWLDWCELGSPVWAKRIGDPPEQMSEMGRSFSTKLAESVSMVASLVLHSAFFVELNSWPVFSILLAQSCPRLERKPDVVWCCYGILCNHSN
jgi:hypothetical protein